MVDDDRSVVEAMISLLQSVGFKAEGFNSAEDFLCSRRLLNTECLVVDVHMPSMGGFELYNKLVANNHRIPVVFITGYDNADVLVQAVPPVPLRLLHKPFTEESLLQAIRAALASRRAP